MNEIHLSQFETWTLLALLLISVGYAVFLQWWERNYPEGFADNTWVMVVIGVSFTLAAQMVVMPLRPWLLACATFIASGLPIIARSIINLSRRRREANGAGTDANAE